jgi:chorismate mutase
MCVLLPVSSDKKNNFLPPFFREVMRDVKSLQEKYPD